MRNLLLLGLVLFALIYRSNFELSAQVVPEQSVVTFKVSHMGGNVTGTFTGMQGTVNFDENNLAGSSMEVTVNANSIDTKNRARDSDLRKEKFFDVEKYPQIRFKSKEITRTADGFQVRGDLTIKDQTREENIPFRLEKQETGTLFTGEFTVNRKNYNLGQSSFPPIGKVVQVEIKALVKKS